MRIGASPLRSLIGPIYLPSFLVAMGMGMVMPVLPLFAQSLGASLAATGSVIMLIGVGNMVADLPAGIVVARIAKRTVMVATLVASIVLAAVTGMNRSVPLLAVLMVVTGASQALFFISRLDHVREIIPPARRGVALALVGGVNRLGMFMGPVVGGFLGQNFGLAMPFYGKAVCYAAALVAIVLTLGPDGHVIPEPTGHGVLRSVWRTMVDHRRSYMTAGMTVVALSLIRAGRGFLFPLWGRQIGLDVAAIGLIMGVSGAADMLLFYPAGLIMDRAGRKWAAVPCLILLSLALALVPLTRGFAGLMLVGILAGIGNGLGSGINMTLSTDLAPRKGSGEFLGIWRLIGDTGTASGPILIGAIAQAVALGPAAVAVAGIGLIGAVLVMMLVPETLRSALDPETRNLD